MIIALASVVNYDRQSDAPIWSVTSIGVNYDRKKFIIQATARTVKISYTRIKEQTEFQFQFKFFCFISNQIIEQFKY